MNWRHGWITPPRFSGGVTYLKWSALTNSCTPYKPSQDCCVTATYKTLSEFLWQRRRPRIAMHKLLLPRSEGGAKLPNLRVYNLSCLLRVCMDWITQSSKYTNHELETHLASPYSLPALLHCKLRSIPAHLQQNLLICDT